MRISEIYGISIGYEPVIPSNIHILIKWMNPIVNSGRNFRLFMSIFNIYGVRINILILFIKLNTPPSLSGILRNIEKKGKKYHSGTIWAGVINGLAIIKLS